MRWPRFAALTLVLPLAACLRDLPRPDEPLASETYRQELDVRPHSPRAYQARQQLEVAEFESAKAAHTILAYRRFLEEFPEGAHATDIRARLAELRWAEAEKDGSQAALKGFLADEPSSVHAQEAWARLSALQLEAALREGTPQALRSWLQENPTAPGPSRETALVALDQADFRAAQDPEGMRAYLAAHEGGAHRAEAVAALAKAQLEEAALLEDEPLLRQLAQAGSSEAAREAGEVAYRRAAALLDEGRLAQLGRKGDARAAQDLAALQRARGAVLEPAAQRLFLPRATLDELPPGPLERAAALREWALSLDGARLPRLLAELSSQRSWVASTALQAALALLAGLPKPELKVRAGRLVAQLRPTALDAPRLAQVALLERALGDRPAALADAREAIARDPRCLVASELALLLETEAGEPAVRALAARSLLARARELEEAHGHGVRLSPPQWPDALALREICAGARAATQAAAAAPELHEQAEGLRQRLLEAERAQGPGFVGCDAEDEGARAAASRAAASRLEAARVLSRSGSPLVRCSLARARLRDPEPEVREAAGLVQSAQALAPR